MRDDASQTMMERIPTRSLRAQLILSFILLILLAAVAAGIPAVWLLQSQLSRQAWAQIDQGVQAARALYAAEEKRVADMATLAAQRPTLDSLLAEGDHAALLGYLSELQEGAGFDLVSVCADGREVVSYAVEPFAGDPCAWSGPPGYFAIPAGSGPAQVWLLAAHPIPEGASAPGQVVVGQVLDGAFAGQMQAQTGLAHNLWANGWLAATTLADGAALLDAPRQDVEPETGANRTIFTLEGERFYAARISLDEAGIEAEVALPVAGITTTQRRSIWTLVGGIAGTAIVASGVGTLLARRFSRPLVQLVRSANSIRKGELDHEIVVDASFHEVLGLADTLEKARVDLKEILLHLQKERDWADHLLESIVEGIVILDRDRRITYFSAGAEQIVGRGRESVLGCPVDEVFKSTDDESLFSRQVPRPGQRVSVPVAFEPGQPVTLSVTRARLAPAEVAEGGEVLVFRDISEEETLHRLLGHFMGSVAHEFKTPLSALAASIELLLDQAHDLNRAELNELLVSLHLGILGLQTLVDNLLESANIEAKRFRVTPRACDLGQIVGEAAQTMEPLLRKYDQHLVIELPATIPAVYADPRRTVQVLVNLLSNASKYGPTDAEIGLSVLPGDGTVRVQVADRGAGMPPRLREQVFRRFVHPEIKGEHEKAGAGLGLSVVKAIVEAQGGQVGVEDRVGGGSVFWFTVSVADGQ
jgi:PAS domain S-box-containing protein